MIEKNNKKNQIIIGCLCSICCETLFGLSYIFTKEATNNNSSLSLLGWRFFIAFIVMSFFIFTKIIKVNYKGKKIKNLLLIALFSPILYFVGETFGISNTTASESGIFLACIPVVSIVFSTLILHKKPARHQIVGILITLLGVVFTVAVNGFTIDFSIIGYLCLLLAVVSYAFYSVFVEITNEFSGVEITYIMIVLGFIVFSLLALIESLFNGTTIELFKLPFNDTNFLIAILYQGIFCSVLAFFLSNIAITKIGVNGASSFLGVSTVVSIISACIVLKETISVYQIIGSVVIILGVYLANVVIKQKIR